MSLASQSIAQIIPDPNRPPLSSFVGRPIASAAYTAQALLRSQKNILYTFHPDEISQPLGFRRVSMFKREFVRITDADLAKQVLVEHHRKQDKGEVFRNFLKPTLGEGLLTAEGATWRRHRKLMNPAFHEAALQNIADIIDRRSAARVAQVQTACGNGGESQLNVSRFSSQAAMDLAMNALFSSDLAGREAQMSADMAMTLRLVRAPHLFDLIGLPRWVPRGQQDPQLIRALGRVNSSLERVLYQRFAVANDQGKAVPGASAEQAPTPDLLSLMLAKPWPSAPTDHANDEQGLNADELRDEIFTMFAAGHETTALAMGWALTLLALHPQWQEKAAQEAHLVVDPSQGSAFQRARQAPILTSIINETLRLYPPASIIVRSALEPMTLQFNGEDQLVEPGATLAIPIFILHRHPDYWAEPNAFEPALHFGGEAAKARPSHAFMPFGGGPRLCIGKHFAMIEAVLLLAHTLKQFEFLAPKPGSAQDQALAASMMPVARVTLRPTSDLVLSVRQRG